MQEIVFCQMEFCLADVYKSGYETLNYSRDICLALGQKSLGYSSTCWLLILPLFVFLFFFPLILFSFILNVIQGKIHFEGRCRYIN